MFHMSIMLICVCITVTWTDALTKQEEIENNKVQLTFYDLTDSKWSDKMEKFQMSVASYTSALCEDDLDLCELVTWSEQFEFAGSDVLQEGDSEADGASLMLYIYVQFNDVLAAATNDTEDTNYILVKAALEEVLIEHRSDINDEADVTITGIGNAEYALSPTKTLNIIMITVGFAIILILIIIWISLYYWKKNSERKEALKAGKLTCVVGKRTDKEIKKRKREERMMKQRDARSPQFSAVSKSKVVPIMNENDNSKNTIPSPPPEATYHSPAPHIYSVPLPAVNHTEATPTNHKHSGKSEKRIHMNNSNYFSEEKLDVDSRKSMDTLNDSKNRTLDSNADAAGATAVFQAHSADSHNDSHERKRRKHKKRKSKQSDEMESVPAVISMETELQEKTSNPNESRQETDSDTDKQDMSRVGYRMC